MSKQVYCQLHDIESLDHKAKAHKDCHLEAEQVLENRRQKVCQKTPRKDDVEIERKSMHSTVNLKHMLIQLTLKYPSVSYMDRVVMTSENYHPKVGGWENTTTSICLVMPKLFWL